MNIDELPVKDSLSGEQIEYLQKKQNEFKHIGKLKKVPGHTLFSFNRRTGEIKPAEFFYKCSLALDGTVKEETRCVVEPDCFYEQALNRKNFVKKLIRLGLLVRKEATR